MSKKIKICILGSRGMLGGMCYKHLSQNALFEVHTADRTLDRNGNPSGRLNYDWNNHYQYLVYCCGKIKPFIKNETYEEIEAAVEANINLPYEISRCRNYDVCLSIATDCVFSGIMDSSDIKGTPYFESSSHNCLDVYGKSKSLGEIKSDRWKNLRCSIIGPEFNGNKRSLLEWFLSQPKNAEINGFLSHFWNGISTLEYAKICERIMLNNIELPNIHHICPYSFISKCQLLGHFQKTFRPDIYVKPVDTNEAVFRVLGTRNPELNEKLIGCKELSIRQMIENLKPYINERLR